MSKLFFNNCNDNSNCFNKKESNVCLDNINKCVCNRYPIGVIGPTGPTGPQGGVLNFADFYALMPPDNAATVAPGTDVSFLQDGPNSGSGISRLGASSFNLADIGTYQILF